MNRLFLMLLTVFVISCAEDKKKEEIDYTPKIFNNIYPQDKSTIFKDSITVDWASSEAQGDPIVYTLEYWKTTDKSKRKSFQTTKTQLRIENLLSNTDYQWRVTALNDAKQLRTQGDIWDLKVGYIPYPQIYGVDKDRVRLTEVLTIRGKDFKLVDPNNLPRVRLNNIPTQVLLRTNDSIQIVVPKQVDNPLRIDFSDRTLEFKQTIQYYAYEVKKTPIQVVSADDTITFYGDYFASYKEKPTLSIDHKQIDPFLIHDDSISFVVKPDFGKKLNISLLGFDQFVADLDITPFLFNGVNPKKFGPGDIIVLKGKYFSKGKNKPTVTLADGTPVEVISQDDETIKIKVPDRGKLPIKVSKDGKTVSLNTGIELQSFEIDSVRPKIINAGDEMVIHGQYYGTDLTKVKAMFGDQQAQILKLYNDSIRVRVLTGSYSPLKLTVRGETKEYDDFTIITDFEVLSSGAIAKIGDTFSVFGKGFGNNLAGVKVRFFENIYSSLRYVNDTRIQLIVPNVGWNAVGKALDVQIATYKKSHSKFQLIPFNYSEVKPAHSRVGDTTVRVGEQILVNGIGFGSDPNRVTLSYNGQNIKAVATNANQIRSDIPASNPQKPIRLTIDVNGTDLSLDLKAKVRFVPFNFLNFSPTTLKTGEVLTITGLELDIDKPNTKVLINDQAITSFTSHLNKEIKFNVPNTIQNGKVSVIINKDTIQHPNTVRVIDYLVTGSAPVAQVFSPFHVTGLGFSGGKDVVVKFGVMIIPPSAYTIVSDTRIEFKSLPPGVQKPFSFSKNGNDPQTYSGFDIHPFKITSLDKDKVQSLERLTINGEIFPTTPTPVVKFDKKVATVVNHSQKAITVTVPIGARLPLIVTDGTHSDTLKTKPDITPYVLTTFSPKKLRVTDTVTLQGQGFGTDKTAGKISINSVEVKVANIVSWKDGEIKVKIDKALRKGKVKVEIYGKSLTYDDELDIIPFKIISSDKIAFIRSPFSLEGVNFGTDLGAIKVSFGDIPVVVTALTDTKLTFNVPGSPVKPIKITKEGYTLEWSKFEIVNSMVSGVDKNLLHVDEELTISGEGFGRDPAQIEVFFGEDKATLISVSDLAIKVKMGLNKQPTLPLKVKVRGYEIVQNPDLVFHHYKIDDNTTKYKAGDEVTITGKGFFGNKTDYTFKLGKLNYNSADITSFEPNKIKFTLKAHEFGDFIVNKAVTTPRVFTLRDSTNVLDITPFKFIGDVSKDTVFVDESMDISGLGFLPAPGIYTSFKIEEWRRSKNYDMVPILDKRTDVLLNKTLNLGQKIDSIKVHGTYEIYGKSYSKTITLTDFKYQVPFKVTSLMTYPFTDTIRTAGDSIEFKVQGVNTNTISFYIVPPGQSFKDGKVLDDTYFGKANQVAETPKLLELGTGAVADVNTQYTFKNLIWGNFKGDLYFGVEGVYMPLKKVNPKLTILDYKFDFIQQARGPITPASSGVTWTFVSEQKARQILSPQVETTIFLAKQPDFSLSKLSLDIAGDRSAITEIVESADKFDDRSRNDFLLIKFKTKAGVEGNLGITYDGQKVHYEHPLLVMPFRLINHSPSPTIEYLGQLTLNGQGFGHYKNTNFTVTFGLTPKVSVPQSDITIQPDVVLDGGVKYDQLIISQVPANVKMPIIVQLDVHKDFVDSLKDDKNEIKFKFQQSRIEKQRDFFNDLKKDNKGNLDAYNFDDSFCISMAPITKIAITTVCGAPYDSRVKELKIHSDGTTNTVISPSISDLIYLEKLTLLDQKETPFDLPTGLGNLVALKELYLRSIGDLPSLENLVNLQKLHLDNDGTLVMKELLFDLNKMTQLEELTLSDYYPQTNKEINISTLKRLNIEGVSASMKFGASTNLSNLTLNNYVGDVKVSGLEKLINLVELEISGSSELPSLLALTKLNNMTLSLANSSAQTLEISSKAVNIILKNSVIYTMSGLANNTNLKTLNLQSVSKLSTLGSVITLPKLEKLDVVNLPDLTTVPDIQNTSLPLLKTLNISKAGITSIPTNIQHLTKIQEITLDDLSALTALPANFGQLSTLVNLKVNKTRITSITKGMVSTLSNLEEVFIQNNAILSIVDSNITKNNNILTLRMDNNNLTNNRPSSKVFQLETDGNNSKLETLILNGNRIKELGNGVCKMKQLKRLAIENNGLEKIPGCIDQLPNLQSLEVVSGNPAVVSEPLLDATFCNKVFSLYDKKPAKLCVTTP